MRSGCVASIHITAISAITTPAGDRRRRLDRRQHARRQSRASVEDPDKRRQQRQHRHQVEHALHDDGGERRRRALSPSVRATRYGRSTSPARAGSSASAAKPMNGCAQHRTEARRPDRIEQIPPPDRAHDRHDGRDDDRPDNQVQSRACAISSATADRFARLRNHAKRAIARSVTSAVRIVIRGFREAYTIYQAPFAPTAGAVAYGCGRSRHPGKMRVSRDPPQDTVATRCAPPRTRLNGLAPHRQGKVRDIYEVGDRLLMVATDRISAFDYVLGSGIPDKGKVLTQLSAFWFEQTRDIVPNHLITIDVPRYPDQTARRRRHARGPLDARPEDESGADRVRGARLSVGIRLEGLSGDRHRLRRAAAARTARIRSAARADLHARHESDERSRREHQRGRSGRIVGDQLDRDAARADAGALRVRRRARRIVRHHPRRHQVRVRSHRATAASCSSTK